MTDIGPVQCLACTRLDRSTTAPGGLPKTVIPVRCAAFPDGIPPEIAGNGDDHRTPRGDEVDGLTFEQIDTDEGRDAFVWWQRTFGHPA